MHAEELSPSLQRRFTIALTWIGRAIDDPDPDVKIVHLSTALESMLTTIADEKKGETLAYRMLLLNALLDESFIHPAKILWIYELRSKIVHGNMLAIASESEYITMKRCVTETLIHSLEVIQKRKAKTHADFIKILESGKHTKDVLHWLEKQHDKWSLSIKNHMIEKLGLPHT